MPYQSPLIKLIGFDLFMNQPKSTIRNFASPSEETRARAVKLWSEFTPAERRAAVAESRRLGFPLRTYLPQSSRAEG